MCHCLLFFEWAFFVIQDNEQSFKRWRRACFVREFQCASFIVIKIDSFYTICSQSINWSNLLIRRIYNFVCRRTYHLRNEKFDQHNWFNIHDKSSSRLRNLLWELIRFKLVLELYFRFHDFYAESEININHKKTRLKTSRLRQILNLFVITRRSFNVMLCERTWKFDTRIEKKYHNNYFFDCFFDQSFV